MTVVDNDREEARYARDSGDAEYRAEVDPYSPGDGDLPPIPAWLIEATRQAQGVTEWPELAVPRA